MDNESGWEDVPEGEQGWEDVPANESEDTPYDPQNPQQGTALIDRIPAANREALRSVGTGEDMADAYMRGLNNPSSSETMQNDALQRFYKKVGIEDISQSNTPYRSAIGNTIKEVLGLGVSATGLATDIATNPKEAIGIALFSRFPSLVKEVNPALAKRISQFATKERSVKDFLPKPKIQKPGSMDVQDMIKQASQEAIDVSNQLTTSKATEMALIRNNYNQTKNGIQTKIDTIDNEVIPKVADTVTKDLRTKYWDYAKDLSNRFGAAWEKAIAGEKIQTQKLYDALGSAIERDGFMVRQPDPNKWSGTQKAIYEYQQSIGSQLPKMSDTTQVVMTPQGPQRVQIQTGQNTMNLSKVDKDLQKILGVKKGQVYNSNDHILSLTREETASAIGDASKRVRDVRMKFAPEYQAKNELTKMVQPFNRAGEFDTTKGIKFFSDYAQGKMTDPDQLRLVDHIIGSNKLGGSLLNELDIASLERNGYQMSKLKLATDQPAKIQAVQERFNKANQALSKDHQSHISMLDAMKQVAIKDESKDKFIGQLLKATATGAAGTVGAGGIVGAGYLVKKAID